jgi:multidrug transporter EmrE-like cation transporter
MTELLILIGTICSTIIVPFIKLYIETNNFIWFILACFIDLIVIWIYSIILKNNDMIVIYPMMKISSIIILVFIGYILFNSVLDTKKILGILLSIIAIYLLSCKKV